MSRSFAGNVVHDGDCSCRVGGAREVSGAPDVVMCGGDTVVWVQHWSLMVCRVCVWSVCVISLCVLRSQLHTTAMPGLFIASSFQHGSLRVVMTTAGGTTTYRVFVTQKTDYYRYGDNNIMVSLSCLCEDSNTQRLTAHKAQPTPRHCPCSYGVTTGWPLTYIRVHALRVVCAWCLSRRVCLTACAVIVVIGAIQYRSLGSNKFLSFFNYKCVRSCVRVSAKTEHEIISFHHFFSCRKPRDIKVCYDRESGGGEV